MTYIPFECSLIDLTSINSGYNGLTDKFLEDLVIKVNNHLTTYSDKYLYNTAKKNLFITLSRLLLSNTNVDFYVIHRITRVLDRLGVNHCSSKFIASKVIFSKCPADKCVNHINLYKKHLSAKDLSHLKKCFVKNFHTIEMIYEYKDVIGISTALLINECSLSKFNRLVPTIKYEPLVVDRMVKKIIKPIHNRFTNPPAMKALYEVLLYAVKNGRNEIADYFDELNSNVVHRFLSSVVAPKPLDKADFYNALKIFGEDSKFKSNLVSEFINILKYSISYPSILNLYGKEYTKVFIKILESFKYTPRKMFVLFNDNIPIANGILCEEYPELKLYQMLV